MRCRDESVAKLKERYANREGVTFQEIPVGVDDLIVRVGWHESQIAGGWSGGYSRKVEIVRWHAWAGDKYAGGDDRKKGALHNIEITRGSNGTS